MRGVLLKTVLANLIGPLSTFMVAPILARGLGASTRGELAAATMPLTLVAAALTLGLPEALTYYLSRGKADYARSRNRTIKILAVAGVLGSILLLLVSQILAGGNMKVQELIAYSSIFAIPSIIMWASRGLAQGMNQWSKLNAEKIIVGTVRLVAVILLLVCQNMTLEAVFLVYMLAPISGYVAYLNLRKSVPPRNKLNDGAVSGEGLLRFGMNVWWGSLAGILLTRLDQVLMLSVSTDIQLGLYSAAATVADIPLIVTAAVSTLLLSREAEAPSISRTAQASRLTLWFVLLGVSCAGISSYWWFPWAFGAEFEPGISSLLILLFTMAVTAPSSVAGSFMTARGRPSARSISVVIGLAVNLILFFILTPTYGAMGAALATAGGQLAVAIAILIQMKVYFDVRLGQMILLNRCDFIWIADSLKMLLKYIKRQ